MSKTLAIIFNYNAKKMTDDLYESLLPASTEEYDLYILDNGTEKPEEVSANTSVRLEKNVYFGGAVNASFSIFLHNRDKYDSLMILNNDIFVGENFIKVMRQRLFERDFKLISPAVLQPEAQQTCWKHLRNWGAKETREVRWVDYYCPFFHGDLVEHIGKFSDILQIGWGLDLYTGHLCDQKGWKAGVVDSSTVIHFGAQTYKDNKAQIPFSEYGRRAEIGMYQFFQSEGLMKELEDLRQYGLNYTYEG